LKLVKNKTKWLAVVDADEFIFPVQKKNLKEFLKDYEKYCGVGVNWVIYGPSGNIKRPSGNVIQNYLETFEDRNNEMNLRIKSIVQPKKTLICESSHYFLYKKSEFAVDENYKEIVGDGICGKATTTKNSINKIRINHYWTKSLEDLQEKCKRRICRWTF